MSLTEPNTLSREKVKAILKRHSGSVTAIAAELGITPTSVSQWLSGRMTSLKIETACTAKAKQLLKQEAKRAA